VKSTGIQMQQKKSFKQPPKKFHPKGMIILHEDWDILVIDKSAGLLSVNSETVTDSAQSMLNEYVRKGNSKSKNRVFVINPLDKETSGILVFAKTEQARDFLQDKWADFKKKFVAVVQGIPKEEKGVITSFLTENSIHLMYSTEDQAAGMFARTSYEVMKSGPEYAMLEVNPMTERKHQARVHLADMGCPIAGDKKYGKKGAGIKRLCLHASSISLVHPFSKEPITIETQVPGYFNHVLNLAK
jgi:tRNA pseudouridine32 synthase/23S rRNA pseudouridine746 synthase/23S rRNA pseudouridine1911/1915/1917 synthase